jgi:hypothetical protein
VEILVGEGEGGNVAVEVSVPIGPVGNKDGRVPVERASGFTGEPVQAATTAANPTREKTAKMTRMFDLFF